MAITSPLLQPRYIRDTTDARLPGLIQTLTVGATTKAVSILTSYDNVVSPNQEAQLTEIIGRMAMLATGHPGNAGRFVFGMGCGRGKSTSIRTFITETYKLNIVDTPVIVAASKVAQLCELKRDLVADGVPEGDIGLYHSYSYDPLIAERVRRGEMVKPDSFAEEPSTSRHPANFRVVLITHRRVKSAKGEDGLVPMELSDINQELTRPPSIAEAMRYGKDGMKRNLLVWDEGLISSKARTVGLQQIKYELDRLYTDYHHKGLWNQTTHKVLSSAIDWVQACVDALDGEIENQQKYKAPSPIELPKLDKGLYREVSKMLTGRWTDVSSQTKLSASNACADLLRMSDYRLRLIVTGKTNALLRFDIELPTLCDRIVVLDGSFPIRTLEQIDPDMKDGFKASHTKLENLEDYSAVTLHRAKMGSGRNSLRRKVANGELAALIADRLTALGDESCLIFLYKDRSSTDRFESVVREQLERDHNIDLKSTIDTAHGPKLKYPTLTWGNETATNSYSYCDNVLLAGVYHIPEREAAALVVSQQRDLVKKVKQSEVQAAIDGEVFTAAHQAVMRVVRTWDGDKAKAKKLWVLYPNSKIETALSVVMSKLTIKSWDITGADGATTMAHYEKLAVDIMEYLNGIPEDVNKVSVRAVMANFDGYTKRVREDALEVVKTEIIGWDTEGRSFVRRNVFSDETELAA